MNHHSFISSFKILKPFIWGASLTVIFIAVVNIFIDIKGLYNSTKVKQDFYHHFGSSLTKTSHTLLIPESERWAKYFFGQSANPSAYVLGSSRAMQINAKMLNTDYIANLGVSGGSFEDFETFIGMILKKQGTPKIYIVVDPWFFSKESDIRYMELKQFYKDSLSHININKQVNDNEFTAELIYNIFNRDYFVHNINFLFESLMYRHQSSKFRSSFRSDGTLQYSQEEEIKSKMKKYEEITNFFYKFESFNQDEKIVNEFKAIHDICKKRGIEFVFIELPYHPRTWQSDLSFEKVTNGLEAHHMFLSKLSKELGIPLIGHFDPAQYNLQHEDFYDAIHLREPALEKVFSHRN